MRSYARTLAGSSQVYLDESYVNKNHSNDFTWYSKEDSPWLQKPTGKGERLIIINAITKGGWVPNAKVVFKSTRGHDIVLTRANGATLKVEQLQHNDLIKLIEQFCEVSP